MANDETRELANLAEVFKALGHPTRLWIAKNLEGKELCVCDFVTGTGEDSASVISSPEPARSFPRSASI